MTKDEMRALLADLVPTAHVYRFNRVGSGNASMADTVRVAPNRKVVVQRKPMVPKRIDPVTQRPVQTFKRHTDPATPYYATVAARISARSDATRSALVSTTFYCAACDNHGAACTC